MAKKDIHVLPHPAGWAVKKEGNQRASAPTIDLAVGYSKANSSPILKLFLSRLGELRAAGAGEEALNPRWTDL